MPKGKKPRASKIDNSKNLSLLAPVAVGGVIARQGFRLQDRYVAQRLPHWLLEPAFDGILSEGVDDTDVFRMVDGKRRIRTVQVKGGNFGMVALRDVIDTASQRLKPLLAAGELDGFELATRYPGQEVRSVFDALERLRRIGGLEHLPVSVQNDTVQAWKALLRTHELTPYDGFIRSYLRPQTSLIDIDRDEELFRNIAAHLTSLPVSGGRLTPQLTEVAREFVEAVVASAATLWRRDAIERHLSELVARYASPGAGNVLLIMHETFMPISRVPGHIVLPPALRNLPRTVAAIGPEIGRFVKDKAEIESAVIAVTARNGQFRKALREHQDAAIVYLGFPHVPLAALAGFAVGSQRAVHILEHDRRTNRFEWLAPMDPPRLQTDVKLASGSLARLRVSVSLEVDEAICLLPQELGCDVHVRVAAPALGFVQSEEAAHVVVGEIQRALVQHVAGKGYRELHVFAAAPVSVAFLLGQVLSSNVLPPAVVYNHINFPRPHYNWSLSLYAAAVDTPSVSMLAT